MTESLKSADFTKKAKSKYWFGKGSRKRSVARVRIKQGSGEIIINQKLAENFLNQFAIKKLLNLLDLVGLNKKIDISVIIHGGGKNSAVDAITLGLARAIIKYDPKLRTVLKKTGFLSRNPREKERKKPGLKRARRAPQWQKR